MAKQIDESAGKPQQQQIQQAANNAGNGSASGKGKQDWNSVMSGGQSQSASQPAQSTTAQEKINSFTQSFNDAKGRVRDASVSDAMKKQKERRDEARKVNKPASTVKTSTPKDIKEEAKKDVSPILGVKEQHDPMRSTGFVDQDTGEILDTSIPANAISMAAVGTRGPIVRAKAIADDIDKQNEQKTNQSDRAKTQIISPTQQVESNRTEELPEAKANNIADSSIGTRPNQVASQISDDEAQKNRSDYRRRRQIADDFANFSGIIKEKDQSDEDAIKEHRRHLAQEKPYEQFYPDMKATADNSIVTVNEETGESQLMTDYDYKRYNRHKAEDITRRVYMSGGCRIKGTKIDDNGYMVFPDTVQQQIDFWREQLDCSVTEVMQLVMLRLGIGVDKDGQIMKDSYENFEIDEDQFLQASIMMGKSIELNGHPLGHVPGVQLRIGSSWRFAIPVYPKNLAESLVNGKGILNVFETPHNLVEKGREDWLNRVKPAIIANCTGEKINQRYALESMCRAIADIDGKDVTAYGVSPLEQASFEELMDSAMKAQQVDGDNADVYKQQAERLEIAELRMSRRYKKELRHKDANGNIVYKQRYGKAQQFFMGWANLMRFCGVAANPAIMLSGAAEHIVGNIYSMESNLILGKTIVQEYRITPLLRQMAYTDEAKEATSAYKMLDDAAGVEAQIAFSATGIQPTRESVRKWIAQQANDGNDPNLAQRFSSFLQRNTEWMVPGDLGLRGQDTHLFIQSLCYTMGNAAKNGEPSMTAKDMEQAMAVGGISALISQSMQYKAGREAFVMMKNQNLGRTNPITYWVKRLMQSNGITDWVITTGLDTYVTYGVNLVQVLFPLSNSISYLATRGLTRANAYMNGIGFKEDFFSESRENQLGGNDKFWQGLKKNFIYDAVRIGNISGIMLLAYAIIDILGFDDPEDPLNIFNWDEYRIGGNLGWGRDTNGDEKGDGAIYTPAWWMNELIGWGLPGAVAMHVLKNHPDDPMRSVNVFADGVAHMVDGSSVLDAMDLVRNAEENMKTLDQMTQEEVENVPPTWDSRIKLIADYWIAQSLGKSTPGVIKSFMRDTFFGENAREHTSSKVYDRSEGAAPGATNYEQNEMERQIRQWSKYNPLYGLYNNLTRNWYLLDDGSTEKTGYLFSEMPIATLKDPKRTKMYSDLEIDKKDETLPQGKEEREAYFDQLSEDLMNYCMNGYDSPEQFVTSGGVIPYNRRTEAIKWCYKQILLNKLDYDQKSKDGYYPDFNSSYAAFNNLTKTNQKYYDFLDQYLKNDDIPWSDEGYEKLLSNYQVQYVWKDSGNRPASVIDYYTNGDAVEKRYVPYGDHPTSFALFTEVDQRNRGYNAETINNWWVEGVTPVQKVFDESTGKIIEQGYNADKDLAGVLFGGTGDEKNPSGYNNLNGPTTINARSYVAKDGALPEDLKNINEKSVAEELGIDTEALNDNSDSSGKSKGSKNNTKTWKSYTGRSGGSGSSSGSSPRIYSNPRSINADKAATMYTKQPYGATTTYLRPSFSTKGSREAYKRQDM